MNKHELIPKLAKKVSFHEFDKGTYFVHQKEFDHRIKISQEVYDLLQILDGKKSLSDINNELPFVEIDFLYNLLYIQLGKYGIVESNSINIKVKEKPNYLKLSFIVISPKIISRITPFLKTLFIPKIMKIIIAFCCTLILFSLFRNYGIILNQNIEELNWGMFFVLGFISVTFHEFGHVTAAEYFGAKHGGIGGGFYLLSPVYFADVTDIWKLKPKQRIIVNLAGIYFELIMCSIFLLIGIFTKSELLIITGVIIFLKTLFNLNPFLRSDGYWILTDFLRIANLYKVSNEALGSFIKSLLFKGIKYDYSKKNILLALYASVNYMMLFSFVFYVIVYNSQSVLYFPYNLYVFVEDVMKHNKVFQIKDIGQFVIPLLFYYLLFNLVRSVLCKAKNNNSAPKNETGL